MLSMPVSVAMPVAVCARIHLLPSEFSYHVNAERRSALTQARQSIGNSPLENGMATPQVLSTERHFDFIHWMPL